MVDNDDLIGFILNNKRINHSKMGDNWKRKKKTFQFVLCHKYNYKIDIRMYIHT